MLGDLQLWLRPWALLDRSGRYRIALGGGDLGVPEGHAGTIWLYGRTGAGLPQIDRRQGNGLAPVEGFATRGERSLAQLPLPLRGSGFVVKAANGTAAVRWPGVPARPGSVGMGPAEGDERARRLLLRAQSVWDRLHDIDAAMADPATLWQELHGLWTGTAAQTEPTMAPIVVQARELREVLERLDAKPRQILRRTHRQIPVSRAQELDRRALTWLVRQPGETLAERAGDRQRILAVAREENFDTLENRVLRAYAALAYRVGRDYVERNRARPHSRRVQQVDAYSRLARRLERDLAARGVRLADSGVTPNFVLQQNIDYRRIWDGWMDLLKDERIVDELWSWQARSFEEFAALALVVSLVSIPGAELIASAPIVFREDQHLGSWLEQDNPIAVFHLPRQRLVVEVRYRMRQPGAARADLAAPIWLAIGRVGDSAAFLSAVAVWPVWHVDGGLDTEEIGLIRLGLQLARDAKVAGAVVIRPAAGKFESIEDRGVLGVTLGTDSTPLAEGIAGLSRFIVSILDRA